MTHLLYAVDLVKDLNTLCGILTVLYNTIAVFCVTLHSFVTLDPWNV